MPSPSQPQIRLELLAALAFAGVAALGVLFLISSPQQFSMLSNAKQLRLLWTQSSQANEETHEGKLSLPLIGQSDRRRGSNSINVPPPVIPQISPPETQATTALANRPQASPFRDLDASHWAYPMVTELLSRDLVSGFPDGSFQPDRPMSRSGFASQHARSFDLSLVREAKPFTDVKPGNWALQDIQKALQMGFLTGYPDSQFYPDETIDRIQVLTALAQGLNLKSSSGTRALLRYYNDYDKVPEWAVRNRSH